MKNKKAARRKRIYIFIIFALVSFLGYKMFSYWPRIFANYQEKKKLEAQYNELLEEEAILTGNINKLKDPKYIARFAREKYLYSKNGELIIRIVE